MGARGIPAVQKVALARVAAYAAHVTDSHLALQDRHGRRSAHASDYKSAIEISSSSLKECITNFMWTVSRRHSLHEICHSTAMRRTARRVRTPEAEDMRSPAQRASQARPAFAFFACSSAFPDFALLMDPHDPAAPRRSRSKRHGFSKRCGAYSDLRDARLTS